MSRGQRKRRPRVDGARGFGDPGQAIDPGFDALRRLIDDRAPVHDVHQARGQGRPVRERQQVEQRHARLPRTGRKGELRRNAAFPETRVEPALPRVGVARPCDPFEVGDARTVHLHIRDGGATTTCVTARC